MPHNNWGVYPLLRVPLPVASLRKFFHVGFSGEVPDFLWCALGRLCPQSYTRYAVESPRKRGSPQRHIGCLRAWKSEMIT